MSLLAELKRRNVVRVAILYAASSWFALQVADLGMSLLHLPDWTGRLVLVVAAIGLPLVLVFSWVYEVTPQGIRKDADVRPDAASSAEAHRRLDVATLVVVTLAFAALATDRLIPLVEQNETLGTPEEAAAVPTKALPAVGLPTRSIAVLPFLDLSPSGDQQYFSHGLSEELINLLARVPDLRVIGRTSSFQFAGRHVDLRSIGAQLGVGTLLEGSVRTSGGRVRVTAQLIDAADGSHLWSEEYDRELDDVFALQDEIATTIVQKLRMTLLGGVLPVRHAPRSVEAYSLFLRGRYLHDRRSSEELGRAIEYYEEALRLDPQYALAWAALSLAYALQADSGYTDVAAGYSKARDAAARARALDSELAEAYVARGRISMAYDWDWARAREELELALTLDPGNIEALMMSGNLALTLGRADEAIELYQRARDRDPLRAAAHNNFGIACYFAGRLAEAEAAFHRLLELSPGRAGAHYFLTRVLLARDDAQSALRMAGLESGEVWRLQALALARDAIGARREADAALQQLIEQFANQAAFQIAEVYAHRRAADEAFNWLERAYEQHDGGLPHLQGNPLFAGLRTDPRYESLRTRLQLTQ